MWSFRKRTSVFGFSVGILWKDNRYNDYSKSFTFEVPVQFFWWRLKFSYTFQKRLVTSEETSDMKSEEK